jgi:predicted DNA binding CopG/RHH family protein
MSNMPRIVKVASQNLLIVRKRQLFWDTHDVSDYWDELKPVKLRVSKNLSKGITIRLDEETLETLRQQAHKKGIGPTTLARMWILERLQSNSAPQQTHPR